MLYVGTAVELPITATLDLRIERVEPAREVVKQWFSHPAVAFVGAYTGCSCGFPSFTAEEPVEYYEGMPFDSDDRAADLRSVEALLELIRNTAVSSEFIELYPVADADESKSPKGRIEWHVADLDPQRFFFNEGFMHVVCRDPARILSSEFPVQRS